MMSSFTCFQGVTQKMGIAVVWVITLFILSTQMASVDISNIEPVPNPQTSYVSRNTTVPLALCADKNETNQSTIYSRARNQTVPPAATTGWVNYRLGDMFRSYKQRLTKWGWENHVRSFNASIATEYMRRVEDPFNETSDGDYHTMLQILNE